MARDRLRNPHLQGVIVLDKPAGITSHQAVARVRASMRLGKVGHAGTLDPFATGVLPLLINSATRVAPLLGADDKVYEGVMRLGVATDTLDPTGEVLEQRPLDGVDDARVRDAVEAYRGDLEQIPPMFSAVKIGGERLYKLARKNVEVERKPKPITIHASELLDVALPDARFRVRCSPGTYVRVMVDEIGKTLGCGAHLADLVRRRSGRFELEHAVSLDAIDELGSRFRDLETAHEPTADGRRWRWPHDEASAWWIEQLGPALRTLPQSVGLTTLALGSEQARAIQHGEPLRAEGFARLPGPPAFAAGEQLLALHPEGRTAAILRATCRSDLAPRMPARAAVLEVTRVLIPH